MIGSKTVAGVLNTRMRAAEKGEPGQNPGSRPPTVLRREPARGRSPK